jgi:hypothetical protein
MASFDAAYAGGADIVIVPAMHEDDDPAIIAWPNAGRGPALHRTLAGATHARAHATAGAWLKG